MVTSPAEFLSTIAIGTRVVARYRVAGGFTDALGYVHSCDANSCTILTRRGQVTVPLGDVVAAKRVPPPPERRAAGHTNPAPTG